MVTSEITRNYWIEKAKGWAEAKLSPPQADEFISVMDELRAEIAALQARLAARFQGRPMSEAPRDGTQILAKARDKFGKYFVVVAWGEVCGQWIGHAREYDDDEIFRWWPLPGSEK